MVEQYPDKFDQKPKELVNAQLEQINTWIRLVQKALTVEAENGFRNLHGRNEYFNVFLSREISLFKSPLVRHDIYTRLRSFSKSFVSRSSFK